MLYALILLLSSSLLSSVNAAVAAKTMHRVHFQRLSIERVYVSVAFFEAIFSRNAVFPTTIRIIMCRATGLTVCYGQVEQFKIMIIKAIVEYDMRKELS